MLFTGWEVRIGRNCALASLINRHSFIFPRIEQLLSRKCFSSIANCIRLRFLISQFLATEALGKMTLAEEIVRRQFPSIRASNVLALHFKLKFDQLFVQRVLRSGLTSSLQIQN